MNIFKQKYKAYLEAGYSVIPDRYMGKTPLIKGWSAFCDKQPSEQECEGWVGQFSDTNIAVTLGAASGIIALDLDTVDQAILDLIYPILPESPVVKRGAKGETRFFRFMNEATAKVAFNGEMVIEVLSSGRKTTLPPSIHPNGAAYEWIGKKELLQVRASELPVLPPMLLSHIESVLRVNFKEQLTSSGNLKLDTTGRHSKLIKLCGELIKDRVDLNKAIEKLVHIDETDSEVPYFTDPQEWSHTEPFTNALTMYTNVLRCVNAKHFRNNQEYEVPIMPGPVEISLKEKLIEKKLQGQAGTKRLSLESLPVRGVIRTLQQFVLKNSFKEQPDFALASAFTTVATILGQRYVFNGTAPNLYTLLLGESGTGKEAPQKVAHKVLVSTFNSKLIGAGQYVSDASLMDTLSRQPVRLDLLDEASDLLRTISGGRSDYTSGMAETLCKIWSASNSLFLGRNVAASNKKMLCAVCKEEYEENAIKGRSYRPQMNIIMATTYTGFEESITLASLEKGLLGRFLIFTANANAEEKLLVNNTELDPTTSEYLDRLGRQKVPLNSHYKYQGVTYAVNDVPLAEGAKQELERIYTHFRTLFKATPRGSALLPVLARLTQQFNKLALIHAAGRSLNPVVDVIDLQVAEQISLYNLAQFKNLIDMFLFKTKLEKDYKIILRALRNHSGELLLDDLVYELRPYLKRRQIQDLLVEMELQKEVAWITSPEGRQGIKLVTKGNN